MVLLFPFLLGVTGTGYSFCYTFKIHNNTLECIMYFSQNIIFIKRYCIYKITQESMYKIVLNNKKTFRDSNLIAI